MKAVRLTVVLLMLIYYLMYFPLFVEVTCFCVFCHALFCVHSNFAIILKEEKAGCLAIIDLQMYCNYGCSVALPHRALGWSAVCDCGVS